MFSNVTFPPSLTIRGMCAALIIITGAGCSNSLKQPAKNVQTYKDAEGNVESITFMGRDVTDSDLQQLSTINSLKELLIQECSNVTDSGFSAVSGAPELISLKIQHAPITDQGLESLEGFSKLSDLQLINTQITGSGFQYLKAAPVTTMRLQGDALTSEGLAGLSALDDLETLTLLTTSANIGDVPAFGSLKSLTVFDGSRAPVGEAGLDVLKGLPNLRVLKIASSEVNDDDIDALNTLLELEELHLLQASITDSGLARLKLPNLKTLVLAGCGTITDEALSSLDGLPQLESLNIQFAYGVEGKSLEDLAELKNLTSFQMTESFFRGDRESIEKLKELKPDLRVSLVGN